MNALRDKTKAWWEATANRFVEDQRQHVLRARATRLLQNPETPEQEFAALLKLVDDFGLSAVARRDGADWKCAFAAAAKRAPKQIEMVNLLVEAGKWIDFVELGEEVWNDSMTDTKVISQLIKRANKTLKAVEAPLMISRKGEKGARVLFLKF